MAVTAGGNSWETLGFQERRDGDGLHWGEVMELGFILELERSQVYNLGLGPELVQSQGWRLRQDLGWAMLINRGAYGTP